MEIGSARLFYLRDVQIAQSINYPFMNITYRTGFGWQQLGSSDEDITVR